MPQHARSIGIDSMTPLENNDSPFMTVEEAANCARSPVGSFYLWLANTGANGGKRRKRFPVDIYVRLGRKVLFIRAKFMDWLMNGAQFEGGN